MDNQEFEVQTPGIRVHVALREDGLVIASFRSSECAPIELFRASIEADDDGSTVLTPLVMTGRPAPDPDTLEYVAAAVRERVEGWGPPMLWANYDWREVMKYALTHCSPVEGFGGVGNGFEAADVAEVVATADGENDGASWIGVFRLRDGRYAFVEAGCDYTGWDCQASGAARVAGNLNDLLRWALRREDRERLGLALAATEERAGGAKR